MTEKKNVKNEEKLQCILAAPHVHGGKRKAALTKIFDEILPAKKRNKYSTVCKTITS